MTMIAKHVLLLGITRVETRVVLRSVRPRAFCPWLYKMLYRHSHTLFIILSPIK